jgi:hypothetical protein
MVYLEEGTHKRTFYHREYTDYLNVEYQNLSMKLNVKRFYKNELSLNQAIPKITVRIIGASVSSELKISEMSD